MIDQLNQKTFIIFISELKCEASGVPQPHYSWFDNTRRKS